MTITNRWLLPEGIDQTLPPKAEQLDKLCREIVDQYLLYGYELVIPPLIEYLESLLTGTGEDLELQTFKLTDQLSGRMMGVRADSTPQIVRIDVHSLKRSLPSRLCYLGPVLHTRPGSHGGPRELLQSGAELYGSSALESDAEIIVLMLQTLKRAGLGNLHVDLGHVGIYRGITAKLALSAAHEALLFDALQRKASAELASIIELWSLPVNISDSIMALIELNGGPEILEDARHLLKNEEADVLRSIDDLQRIAELVTRQYRNAPLFFDLAELRGYHYYTGMSFAAYIPGQGQGIAFGGRYDDIGKAFGQARPATGFSTDIKTLFNLAGQETPVRKGIFAPSSEVPGYHEMIASLREQNEIVICELPGQGGGARELNCDRVLVIEAGTWKVRQIQEPIGLRGS
jgi:ATP phosphoribosyltransferase regulatory subunit